MRGLSLVTSIVPAIILSGSVDQIVDKNAHVEIINSNMEVEHTYLPVSIFPCQIKEGDYFYFVYVDGVTEVRCGEPPI